MENRTPHSESEEMRMGGTAANLAGESGYRGTDKRPEGLSSKSEISILMCGKFFLLLYTLGMFVYVFLHKVDRCVPWRRWEHFNGWSRLG